MNAMHEKAYKISLHQDD